MTSTILFAVLLSVPVSAQEQPPRPLLQLAAQYARYAGDCADTAVIEHSQSFPLPVKTAKGLRYRQMYYPAVSAERGQRQGKAVHPPSAVAQFDGGGVDVTCKVDVSFPKTKSMTALGPQLSTDVAKMTWDAYQSQSAKYYGALERVAKAFDAGKKDAPAREAAAEFQALFDTLSEPGLKAHYHALSPDFWAWLEALKKK